MQPPDKAKVLIVDDDPGARIMLEAALEEEGLEVREASDGAEAFTVARDWYPDVILMDVMMPNRNGFEACEDIRGEPWGQHLPIVLITGLDDIESIRRAYDVGAIDFVTKPLNYTILVQRVRYILRGTRLAQRYRESETRLANAQRLAGLAHFSCLQDDSDGEWSKELNDLLGITGEEGGPRLSTYLQFVPAAERDVVASAMINAFEDGATASVEHRLTRPDGDERVVRLTARLLPDSTTAVPVLLAAVHDQTQQRQQVARIHELSFFDELTGLPNRNFVRKQMRYALSAARRNDDRVALLSIGVDRFARINDTLGYGAGDGVLQQVAERLQCTLRGSDMLARDFVGADTNDGDGRDTIARTGGDEFLIILTNVRQAEDAAVVANRIVKSMDEPIVVDGVNLRITISMGIITFPEDGADVDTLLRNVSSARHHAKQPGVNNFTFYSRTFNERASRRLAMESQMQSAIERDEFRVVYQPRISLQSGEMLGMEALLRWSNPELGNIPPPEFIPLAEEIGLIVPISEWILRTVCGQVMSWKAGGLVDQRVSVNVSAVHFHSNDFCCRVEEIIGNAGLMPDELELEVTEGLLLQDTDLSRDLLGQLREVGIHLAIDDFGTGFSSMAYVKRLPVSTLKIDRSFVMDLDRDKRDMAIVTAIIAMGRGLGLNVVAEGVEKRSHAAMLGNLECHEAQGYYYSKPLEAIDFPIWAGQWASAGTNAVVLDQAASVGS